MRYYVDESFELAHAEGKSLREVEAKVEADNLKRVGRRCRHERNQKQQMVEVAGHYSGAERQQMLDRAAKMAQPWCDEKAHLDELGRRARS